MDLLTGRDTSAANRETFRNMLRRQELEDRRIEIEVPQKASNNRLGFDTGTFSISDMVVTLEKLGMGGKKQKRQMSIAEARYLTSCLEIGNLPVGLTKNAASLLGRT